VQQWQQGPGVLAVRLHDGRFKVEEIETPSLDPGEVRVRVPAAAITRDELLEISGPRVSRETISCLCALQTWPAAARHGQQRARCRFTTVP
jgi:hypothetical protein